MYVFISVYACILHIYVYGVLSNMSCVYEENEETNIYCHLIFFVIQMKWKKTSDTYLTNIP